MTTFPMSNQAETYRLKYGTEVIPVPALFKCEGQERRYGVKFIA
jgi:hypothetical protein